MKSLILALFLLSGCAAGVNNFDAGCVAQRDASLAEIEALRACKAECIPAVLPGKMTCASESLRSTYGDGAGEAAIVYNPFIEAAEKCIGQAKLDECFPPSKD